MAEEQNVNFVVTAVDRATRILQGVGTSLDSVTKRYQSLALTLGRAGPLLAGALVLGKIAQSTIEAERAAARLDATLRATGHSAGITRVELDQIAESLQRGSAFDDDQIRKGLSALLRFRDVQGDVFRDAARLAPDLAAALDTDVVSAYQRLGRALEDPEKGLRALREAGLNVSSAQERVNQVMKETGDVAAAQKIILEELAKSIGGAAAGEKTGIYGALKDTGQAMEDFFKGWGARIKEVVQESENASRRLAALSRMPADLLRALTPEGGAAPGPSREQRDIAAQGAAVQESGRLIAQYQAQVDKEIERIQKETLAREERLREEDIKGWVAHADEVFRQADELNLALAKLSEEHWALEEKLRQEDMKGWIAHAEEVFRAADEENLALAAIADEINNKTKKAAQDLGFTFASAFEDAIVHAEKLRDILQSLLQDILRILIRVNVTQPLAGALASAFGGLFGGGDVYGAVAEGGPISAGGTYLVGERGPELFVPATSGVVVPNHALGGVTLVQNIHFSANTPAAVRDAVFQAAPAIADMTIARLNDVRLRGARV